MLADEAWDGAAGAQEDGLLQEAGLLGEQESPRCMHVEQLETLIGELLAGAASEAASTSICRVLDIYLEQPFLLNPHLASWVPLLAKGWRASIQACEWPWAVAVSRVLVAFCKVQGAKPIRLYFEHEVSDFVPVLLACHRALEHSSSLGPDGWQVRHVAMVMSSTLLLLPFKLERLGAKAAASGHPLLLAHVVEMVRERLTAAGGRERQAAVLFLSALMSRDDYEPAGSRELLRAAVDRLAGAEPQSALGALECVHAVMKQRGSSPQDVVALLDALDRVQESRDGHLRRLRLKIYGQCRGPLSARSLAALTSGLSDADTIVRWTASKGCARLCKDLCPEAAASVAEGLLTTLCANLSSPFPSAPTCHGIALSLAQLCRLRLLPDRLLDPLIQVLARELLRFETPRGKFATTGTAIRDAACFVVWAMVRNYQHGAPDILPGALVCASLLDREVSCRRAAAAALQELVGRWHVPCGVELLDKINFFNTHHLRQTMGETAREIAATCAVYRAAMVEYLINRSIGNWDRQVRTIAAPLLAQLLDSSDAESAAPFREQLLLMAQCSDDIGAQHGAILTLSWLAYDDSAFLSKALPATLLLDRASPKMLGWELIAEAVHRLVAKICQAINKSLPHSLDGSTVDCWLHGALQALQSRDATLHELVAYEVLPALVSLYPVGSPTISDYFRGSILPAADKDRNLHAQRGCTLAIAAFPAWLFQERLLPLSKLLIKFTRGGPGIQIEKQVNAIRVIGSLYGPGCTHAPATVIRDIADAVLGAMDDYTIDARGDIGSLVRLAAMEVLATLSSEDQRPCYEAKLARHIFDKLDRLRRRAAQLFPQPLPDGWTALLETSFDTVRFMELWSVAPLRHFFASWGEPVRTEALLGLISSVGSVNPLVATPAGNLLGSWLEHGVVQRATLLALMDQHCSGRLQGSVLVLLSRLPCLDRELTDGLLAMVQMVASNTRTNMHNVLVAATLLVRLAPIHPPAAAWIAQAAATHPFPRIRQMCSGDSAGTQ